MSIIYTLGWDVGTWKCSGDSQDALQLLAWSDGSPKAVGVPFQGNLWRQTGGRCEVSDFLKAVGAPELSDSDRLILGIDAVFGWPEDFLRLQNGEAVFAPDVSVRNTDNRYLYRETERFLIDALYLRSPYLPKTAVGDAIGTAATKAQHFIAQLSNRDECYVPPLDGWDIEQASSSQVTIIEVYPGATKASEAFGDLDTPAGAKMKSPGKTDPEDALRCAMVGGCYSKTIGTIEADLPDVYLPCELAADLHREGWIFTPKK